MTYDIQLPEEFVSSTTLNLKDKDGDSIFIQENEVLSPDKTDAHLCLRLTNKVTWWKGIILIDNKGMYRTVSDVSGIQDESQCGLLTISDVKKLKTGELSLFFSKAKALGIHTNIYKITNAARVFKPGRQYDFTWLTD